MARITIIDLEWYNKMSRIPKPECMKLSSYHKQNGDIVNFAESSWMIKLPFDSMYVIRSGTAGVIPPEIPMNNKDVYLVGRGFRFYSRYLERLPDIINGCRPDYLLYHIDEENNFSNANIAQFYDNDNQRLRIIQDYHRAGKKTKWTFVIDEDFWNHEYEDLKVCCDYLKKDKNLVFQHRIDVSGFIDDLRKFDCIKDLKFKRNSGLKLYFKSKGKLKDDLLVLKEKLGDCSLNSVPIYVDLDLQNTSIKELTECLDIINFGKQNELIIVPMPPNRYIGAFWFYFEELESWMASKPKESLVEWFASSAARKYGCSVPAVLENKLYWSTPQMEWLSHLARCYSTILSKYGYCQWKDKYYPIFDFRRVLKEWTEW